MDTDDFMEKNETLNGRPIFREVQRMHHAFLWITAVVTCVLSWQMAFNRHLFHWSPGLSLKVKLVMGLTWLFFGVLIPLFLLICRIVTEIRPDGIYVRCVPFQRNFQRIPFTDFKRYEVRTCRLLYDFGGFDSQEGFKGQAYNFGGESSIQFNMTDGRQIMIGSRRADEFLKVLHSQCGRSRRA